MHPSNSQRCLIANPGQPNAAADGCSVCASGTCNVNLKTLQVEPAFPREYVRFGCQLVDPAHGLFWLEDCDVLADAAPRGWIEVLDDPSAAALDARGAAVNPRARCRPIDPASVAVPVARPVRAWAITIDPANEPLAESPWVRPPRACSIATFAFREKPAA